MIELAQQPAADYEASTEAEEIALETLRQLIIKQSFITVEITE